MKTKENQVILLLNCNSSSNLLKILQAISIKNLLAF